MNLEFIVYGSPIAQPRARARAFMAKGKLRVGVYEPQTVKDKSTGIRRVNPIYEWKQKVRAAALESLGLTEQDWQAGKNSLWTGPIKVDIDVYFPRTKELEKAKYPDHLIRYIKKPDRDNLEKAILDSLKNVVFIDDCQICGGEVRKWYAGITERPRAEIRVAQIHEEPVITAARAKRKL